MRLSLIVAAVLLAATVAAADTTTADQCAAGLGKDPRAIYDASVAAVQPGTNLKDLLIEKTRGLVRDGTVGRVSARASARAAYQCLELKQKAE